MAWELVGVEVEASLFRMDGGKEGGCDGAVSPDCEGQRRERRTETQAQWSGESGGFGGHARFSVNSDSLDEPGTYVGPVTTLSIPCRTTDGPGTIAQCRC